MPSATVISNGKPKVQNSEPGSRKKSLMRTALSGQQRCGVAWHLGQSSRRVRPVSDRNTSSSVAVRDTSRVGRTPRSLEARDQRRQRDVRLVDRERETVRPRRLTHRRAPRARRPAPRRGSGGSVRQLDQVLAADAIDELGRRAEGDELAVVDDGHPIAEALRLVHVVGGQDDGLAPRAQRRDGVPERAARLRIEPGRRLVEKQHLGIADQPQRHRQPLALPARQLHDPGGPLLLELHLAEQGLDLERAARE